MRIKLRTVKYPIKDKEIKRIGIFLKVRYKRFVVESIEVNDAQPLRGAIHIDSHFGNVGGHWQWCGHLSGHRGGHV